MEETKVLAERKCITKRVSIEQDKSCCCTAAATKKRKVSIEYNPVTKKMKLLMVQKIKPKVSIQDIIPEDLLVHQILVRLDVEDLFRCKGVCKSWKSSISHPHFVKAHQDRCRRLKNDHNGQPMVIIPLYLPTTDQNYVFLGSSNGLVCINSIQGNEFSVANPWTRQERMVQKHLPAEESCWGFGYDPLTDDYKIVFGVKEGKYRTSFQVLSLKSNVWKHIGHVNGICTRRELATLCNGALHWLMLHEGQEKFIISFDLSTEVFKEIPGPDGARYNPNKVDIPDMRMLLGAKDECLCIWRLDLNGHPNHTWIMQKYNVKESWEPLGSNIQNKFESIPDFLIDVPDKEWSTYDTWFLKKCNSLPTATIMQSLISPHSSGQ